MTRPAAQAAAVTAGVPEKQSIDVAFAVDARMAAPWAVAVTSLLRHASPDRPVRVYLLDMGLPATQRGRAAALVERFSSAKLEFIDNIHERLDGCPAVGHLSQAAYARLCLPELLPDLDRVIYLDCDLLVCGSLDELWEWDLEGATVAAAWDPSYDRIGDTDAVGYASDLANADARYFNSGVMVLDLARWRESGVTEQTLRFVQQHADKLNLADQDALNAVCGGDCSRLPDEWNALVRVRNEWRHWRPADSRSPTGASARVLHFASALKPWNSGPRHPYLWVYTRQLAASGWMRLGEWPRYFASSVMPVWVRRHFRT